MVPLFRAQRSHKDDAGQYPPQQNTFMPSTHVARGTLSLRRPKMIAKQTSSALLLSLLTSFISADSEILPSQRIFNGFDADPDRYPYMVVLRDYFQDYICGGTLIAPDIVLSAAHCGESSGVATVQIGRYDGSNDREPNVETLVVDPNASVRHPLYDSDTMENDFYVIKLFGRAMHHSPIKINSADHIPLFEGSPLTVIGWGSTTQKQELFTSKLQEASLRYVSNKICEAAEGTIDFDDDTVDDRFELWETYEGELSDDMLCAKGDGADACWGDSGGPIFIKGESMQSDLQVGITSWGYSCSDREFPGVYARVSNQFEWIQENVCLIGGLYAPEYFGCNNTESAREIEAGEDRQITIQITFDDRPREQGFVLSTADDGDIVMFQPIGSFISTQPFETSINVNADRRYKFVYFDEGGDGIRPNSGTGDGESPGYKVYVDGELIISSDVGNFLFAQHEINLSTNGRDEMPSMASGTFSRHGSFNWYSMLLIATLTTA